MFDDQVATSLKNHPLYPQFIQVKNKISEKGYVCWIAGGAVRDFILGHTPFDFDLVTNATTEQILTLFPEALKVGIQFGVVKIFLQDNQFFDLATFRRESDYIDGRRPSHVDYATAEEDAFRRDFTMNGLFWNEDMQKIIDYVGGQEDILRKQIKCVGQPRIRFQEDHLRIIRLLRFSVQLGFSIEPYTLQAALSQSHLVSKISAERVWLEFQKMLPGSNWQTLHTNELAQSVFDTLLPCANKTLDNSVPAWPQARYPFFYYLNLVAESFSAMKEALKTKLKISKEDLKIFESINFCLSQKFAIYEWVLEIEDNPMHLLTLEYLVKAKRQSQYFFENIKSKLKDSPVKIVNGHDLVGRIPGIEMANVLKKIRLLQLEQPGLEKESLIKKVISKE